VRVGRSGSPSLDLEPPPPDYLMPDPSHHRIHRRPILAALINEYERAA
jgi:hypothetical protein